MSKKRALEAVLNTAWAMKLDWCELVADIAAREAEYSGNIEALEAKLGRPLGNTERATTRDGIALLPVQGPLFAKANLMTEFSGATSYDMLARDFAVARDDPGVSAIVIKGSSPGGAVEGASEFAQMIHEARGTKPIVAYIEGECCSAFYWIASACDEIVMADTAMAGCLGVQMGLTVKDQKPGEKSLRFVSSNSPNKNADPQTDAGAAQIQSIVDSLEAVFLGAVAKYRATTVENVIESFGQGSVFVAAEAVKRGMADKIQTFEGLLQSLKTEIKSMDYKALTAQALAENRPDLVAEFHAAGVASVQVPDVAAARTEAAKAERERILAIQGLSMPGAEDVIAKAIAEGTDQNATAVHVLKAVQGKQAAAGAAALDNIKAAETGMTPPNASAEGDELTDEQKGIASMEALRKAGVIR